MIILHNLQIITVCGTSASIPKFSPQKCLKQNQAFQTHHLVNFFLSFFPNHVLIINSIIYTTALHWFMGFPLFFWFFLSLQFFCLVIGISTASFRVSSWWLLDFFPLLIFSYFSLKKKNPFGWLVVCEYICSLCWFIVHNKKDASFLSSLLV